MLEARAAPRREAPPVRPLFAWAALLVAGAQLGVALCAGSLSPLGQLGFLALSALPALVLLAAEGLGVRAHSDHRMARAVPGAVVLWAVWRGSVAWHSPRCARLIDLWQNLQVFRAAATSSHSLLTGSAQLGVPNAYLLLLGLPSSGPAAPSVR